MSKTRKNEIWDVLKNITPNSSFTAENKASHHPSRVSKSDTCEPKTTGKTYSGLSILMKKGQKKKEEKVKKMQPRSRKKVKVKKMPHLRYPPDDPMLLEMKRAELKKKRVRTPSSCPEKRTRKPKKPKVQAYEITPTQTLTTRVYNHKPPTVKMPAKPTHY